jgi:phenylacetate-coenzyme A ligase PaaK-like adenylate-forming protein
MSTPSSMTPWPPLPEAEVKRRQAAKLRRYLRDVVVPFSAHYRELFKRLNLRADSFRSLDDLRRLPFTSKADLVLLPDQAQRARDYLLIPDQAVLARRPSTLLRALLQGRAAVKHELESDFRPILMTTTTGRSAEPVPFLYTARDLGLLAEAGRRVFETCGATREMRLLNMFPYAPHLAFWLTHYGGTEFGVYTLSTGGGKVMGTEGQLRFISKIQPDVLIGMPTFLYHVLHLAAEEGIRCPKLRRIVLGGEKVPPGMRLKLVTLARQLGASEVDVVSTYGFTEAKMAWAECPFPIHQPSSGYHLFPDLGLFEVVDPKSGEPVPTGYPGELVFTPLDARGSVVLRYRTGDFIDGGLVYGACPHCGRVTPRLVGNISRATEIKAMHLDKIKGTLVDFNQLEHVLDDMPGIGAWQIELRKQHDDPHELDELILHVQKLGPDSDERLVHELDNRFAAQTEIHPNKILFHAAEEMRRLQGVGVQLKEQKVVDHRPKSTAPISFSSDNPNKMESTP